MNIDQPSPDFGGFVPGREPGEDQDLGSSYPDLGTGHHPADNFTGSSDSRRGTEAKEMPVVPAGPRGVTRPVNPMIEAAKERAAQFEFERKKRAEDLKRKMESKNLSSSQRLQQLDGALSQAAQRCVAEKLSMVGPDNLILTEAYRGGKFYSDAVLKNDEERVADLDRKFGNSVGNAEVVAAMQMLIDGFLKKEAPSRVVASIDRTLADNKFTISAEKSGGILMEKLTAALFFKYFPELLCVGTNKFDDYCNGVDSVIFANGLPVAALDCFLSDDRSGNFIAKKQAKVDAKNDQGGANAKYCFKKVGGEVILEPETNIPLFRSSLDSASMNRAITNLDIGGAENNGEKCAFYQIILSLYEQISDLEMKVRGGRINFGFGNAGRDNREKFEGKLNAFRKTIEKKYPLEDLESYLNEQIDKSKGKSAIKKKRRVSRR